MPRSTLPLAHAHKLRKQGTPIFDLDRTQTYHVWVRDSARLQTWSLDPQAFTVKFTLKLSAAHVAEWVRQLHVDHVVPGSNPAGPEFFFHSFSSHPPKLRYKRFSLVACRGKGGAIAQMVWWPLCISPIIVMTVRSRAGRT